MSEPHSIARMSDEAFGWYLTGLTDGEGCFSFSRFKSQRAFSCRFSIGVRADDTPGLAAIFERIAVGHLRTYAAHPSSNGKSNPVSTWEVHRPADLCRVIIPHFERFPLKLKKARDFAVWKEAVTLLHSTTGRKKRKMPGRGGTFPTITDSERAQLTALAESLRAGRVYVAPK